MNDIDGLIELEKRDSELDTLRSRLDNINDEKISITSGVEHKRSEDQSAHQGLTQDQLKKKELELELESQEQEISKHQRELNTVKTNDAYRALLDQINTAKQSKNQIEDKILEFMESIDNKQKDAKKHEKEFQEFEANAKGKIASLTTEEARIKSNLEQKMKEREEFISQFKHDLRLRYDAIRSNRRGPSVVPVINGTCGGCHFELPPHIVNEVVKNQQLVVCDNCSCFLYVLPKEHTNDSTVPGTEAQVQQI